MDQSTVNVFRGMNTILMNLAIMFSWAVCALFHVIVLVLLLSTIWFLEIDKTEIQTALMNFYHQHEFFPSLVSFFGASGIGVLAGIWVYVKLWKKAFAMFLAHYVCKDF